MIIGIGIDIIELERIEKLLERKSRFPEKILTGYELRQLRTLRSRKRKIEFIAGRFAAKEAFSKAYGTGIGRVGFHDIEIHSTASGAPQLIYANAEDFTIFLSISHSNRYAVAQVVLEQG